MRKQVERAACLYASRTSIVQTAALRVFGLALAAIAITLVACAEPDEPAPTLTTTAIPTATPQPPTPTPIIEVPESPSPLPEPAKPPVWGNISADLMDLRYQLADEIAAYKEAYPAIEVSIAVTDLQSDETVSVNGDRLQRSACTISMFALMAAVKEFEAGNATPEQYSRLIRSGIGSSYPPSVWQFMTAIFDNAKDGVARAQEMMHSWGLEESVFDHVPYYGDGIEDNLLTSRETNSTLSMLYHYELFSTEWTDFTMDQLLAIDTDLNYILPGNLPDTATVAHKMGYHWDRDGWVVNDAGIVTFTGADGETKAYVVSYLSQKDPTQSAGYSFGATLSRIVWDHFEGKYINDTSAEDVVATS